MIKKKKNENKNKTIFGNTAAASSVALCGLSKADAGRGSNTESGIAKPVAPFHHSHRAAVNNLLRINTPLVTNVIRIIQTGSYEAHKPNNLNKK